MAQTGYTPILIYSSSTTSNAPAAGSLTNSTLGSELAINITDGKLFYKDNSNNVQVIAWKTTPTTAGGTGLTSYTAGDLLYYATGTTLTKLSIGASKTILTSSGTAPQWSTSLDTTQGGTGLTAYTAGDLPYFATGTALSKLAIGANTYVLTSSGTAPQWTAPSSVAIGTATNLAGGAAGSVPYQSGAGATTFVSIGSAYQALQVNAGGTAPSWQASATSTLTAQGDLLYASAANTLARLAKNTTATRYLSNTGSSNNPAWAQIDLTNGVTGTLPTTNGGTGLTSFTANGVVYASSTSALTTGSALTFDGSILKVNTTAALTIPVGTTAQRPGSPTTGMVRLNSSTTYPEWYDTVTSTWRTFYSSPATITVDFLVIAGGGGGGGSYNGGGGGAGGYRTSAGTSGGGASAESALSLIVGVPYTVTVGAGGNGGDSGEVSGSIGSNGNNSVLATITSTGGGGGASAGGNNGLTGGSGGGAACQGASVGTKGSGTASQGYDGGSGNYNGTYEQGTGGGGGAGAVGANATSNTCGNGGAGVASSITGSSVTRGGGGGGGGRVDKSRTSGTGGTGGGGDGLTTGAGNPGSANTGGGGGGGGRTSSSANAGGNGGSGVIIFKIPDTRTATFSSGVTSSVSTAVSGYKVYTVTATSTTSETVVFS